MTNLSVFAKYLKNGSADLHQTLSLFKTKSSFKYRNQLMGECLAENIIKEANFPKIVFWIQVQWCWNLVVKYDG